MPFFFIQKNFSHQKWCKNSILDIRIYLVKSERSVLLSPTNEAFFWASWFCSPMTISFFLFTLWEDSSEVFFLEKTKKTFPSPESLIPLNFPLSCLLLPADYQSQEAFKASLRFTTHSTPATSTQMRLFSYPLFWAISFFSLFFISSLRRDLFVWTDFSLF